MQPTRIALHAASSMLGNVEANVATAAKAVARKDADLVVFPEMFLSGYNIGDDIQRLALRLDDDRLEPLINACAKAKVHAVVGGPRTSRKGVTHNSAFLITSSGAVTAYDKRCPPNFTTFEEGKYFTPGTASPVWETEIGNIGVGICYDLYFPEFTKRQALDGADLLLNISASPTTSRRFFELLLQARAVENACFAAYSNVVGAQDGIVFWGGAQAIDPRGQIIGRVNPLKEGRVVVKLDWDDLTPAREFRPTLRDTPDKRLALDDGAKAWPPRSKDHRKAAKATRAVALSKAKR